MPHCLPLDNNYPVVATAPGCNKDGWGWLKRGECGCEPNSPGWKQDLNGCSVRCVGDGPVDCPNCKKPINWAMIGGVGLAAVVLLSMMGPRR